MGIAFLLRCVNPAALPVVRCYSIRLARRVASWVDYTATRTESCTVGTTPVISACWRLMHYDVKNGGVRDRTHVLWIRQRACYPLYHSAPVRLRKLHTERILLLPANDCSIFLALPRHPHKHIAMTLLLHVIDVTNLSIFVNRRWRYRLTSDVPTAFLLTGTTRWHVHGWWWWRQQMSNTSAARWTSFDRNRLRCHGSTQCSQRRVGARWYESRRFFWNCCHSQARIKSTHYRISTIYCELSAIRCVA